MPTWQVSRKLGSFRGSVEQFEIAGENGLRQDVATAAATSSHGVNLPSAAQTASPAGEERSMSAQSASGVLRPARTVLWRNRSLRFQLLLAFALIDLAAVLVAGSLAILRARTQIRVEIAASMRLAELLVGDAANFLHRQLPAEQFLAALPKQLQSLRHVRIEVKNDSGVAVAAPPSVDGGDSALAPGWFATLVAPPAT